MLPDKFPCQMRKELGPFRYDSVPKGTEELNAKAFERGHSYGREQLAGVK